MNKAWLEKIDVNKYLKGDVELIYNECGMEVLLQLWDKLPSLNLYISTKCLQECKRAYIKEHYDGRNAKSLAAELKVSERFVLKVVSRTELRRKKRGS